MSIGLFSLGIIVTSACFHVAGSFPSSQHLFMYASRALVSLPPRLCSILLLIVSFPGAVFLTRLFTEIYISAIVKGRSSSGLGWPSYVISSEPLVASSLLSPRNLALASRRISSCVPGWLRISLWTCCLVVDLLSVLPRRDFRMAHVFLVLSVPCNLVHA